MSAPSAARAIIAIFEDRFSIDQQDGWDEFGDEVRQEIEAIISDELGQ